MSKRSNEIPLNNPKKLKKDDSQNSIWEDELDDDCLGALADKILEQETLKLPNQDPNTSVLPSYDSFRPEVPFASTQITPSCRKLPQNNLNNDVSELKVKIDFLQQKCEAKEGEITILRTNLQKIKAESREELIRKQKEFNENINLKEKEVKSIKNELAFKNLEIANLKQKNVELSRLGISAINQIDIHKKKNRQQNSGISFCTNNGSVKELEVNVLIQPYFPLITKFPPEFFKVPTEFHIVEKKCNLEQRKSLNLILNHTNDEPVPLSPKIDAKIGKHEIGLKDVFPEMIKLIHCDKIEINSVNNEEVIEKIFCLSYRLTENFKDYLTKLEKFYRTEDIEEIDRKYLNSYVMNDGIVVNKENVNYEIGVNAAKILNFISELFLFSDHLRDLISKSPNLWSHYSIESNTRYLTVLKEVIEKIFLLRKADVCHTFLKSTAGLLVKISEKDNSFHNFGHTNVHKLIEFILLTRPRLDVILELLIIFKNCSKYRDFLDFLCNKTGSKTIVSDKKRKIHFFSQETCKFSLFAIVFINNFRELNGKQKISQVAEIVMSFIFNIFSNNPHWILEYHKIDQNASISGRNSINLNIRCSCLKFLYQIAINVAHEIYQNFKNNIKQPKISKLFIVIIQVFKLLTFDPCDLIETDIEIYSKYKETFCGLNEIQENLIDNLDLEKLIISEAVPEIPSEKFILL